MAGQSLDDDSASRGADAATPGSGDHSLVQRLREGSEVTANLLYRRYATRLRALVQARITPALNRRVDADDIVQSVFRRFFEAAHQGRYDAPSRENLWELLLVITLNRLRSEKAFQQAARRDVRKTVEVADQADGFPIADEGDEQAETVLRLTVEEALSQLPSDYRRAVELRLEGLEIAEIATALSRSKRTVERILQESRELLRRCLHDHD
jgi:RNA polymerase sigma-70 factor (ECF subfamily)